MAQLVRIAQSSQELLHPTPERPLKVAWFSYFPVEWLHNLPADLQGLPRQHPATWQRVLWEEFKHDPRLRLEIIITRSQFPRSVRFEKDHTRFHCLRTPPGLRAASLYWLDTLLVGRALKSIKPDLVHGWGSEFGGAAIAGRLPYPALVTMQGILTWYGSVFPLNRHMKLSRFLEPGSLRRARVATCESSFGMRYLAERYPHLKLLQVEHAPSPIFANLARQPRLNPPRLLCVGSFLEWKGADVVVQALNRLPAEVDFELVWIGSKNPALEERLRAATRPEVWQRIVFKHDLPPAQVGEELSQAALFLHAARADNSPNSVKEAVVAGVPVVATHTGGIPDYVKAGKNGLLFKSGDVADCCAKIQAALAHAEFSRGMVDAPTLAEMRQYLSAETMARGFFEAYQSALKIGSRARTSA